MTIVNLQHNKGVETASISRSHRRVSYNWRSLDNFSHPPNILNNHTSQSIPRPRSVLKPNLSFKTLSLSRTRDVLLRMALGQMSTGLTFYANSNYFDNLLVTPDEDSDGWDAVNDNSEYGDHLRTLTQNLSII